MAIKNQFPAATALLRQKALKLTRREIELEIKISKATDNPEWRKVLEDTLKTVRYWRDQFQGAAEVLEMGQNAPVKRNKPIKKDV